jgi:Ni/Co efflux regulator RcnB
MAVSLATGGFAFGQDYGNRNDRGRNEQMQRGDQQDRRDNQGRLPERSGFPERGNNTNDNRDAQRDEHGAGPHREFHRGDRLPPEYRNRQYVVDDWRGHHLSRPPRGYHWVQAGGDYVLVAIGSGIVLQFMLNND